MEAKHVLFSQHKGSVSSSLLLSRMKWGLLACGFFFFGEESHGSVCFPAQVWTIQSPNSVQTARGALPETPLWQCILLLAVIFCNFPLI